MRRFSTLAGLCLFPLLASCSALIDVDTSRLAPVDAGDAGRVTDGASHDLGRLDVPSPSDVFIDRPEVTSDLGHDSSTVDVGSDVTDDTADSAATTDVSDDRQGPDASDPCGDCDDGIDCTTDVCDRATTRCVFTPSNASCPAMSVCDISQRGCVRVDCTTNTDCDDHDLCNGTETCTMGRCLPGTPRHCDDGVACTIDRCDPMTGNCAVTLDNSRCDDGVFCNGSEVCTASGCRDGAAVVCDDHVGCTADRCDESARRCVATANPSACAARGPCVAATCDLARGCVYSPIANFCDSFCVSGATCEVSSGQCRGGGTPRNCSDGNVCTTDVCNPTAMRCVNSAIDADGDGYPAQTVGATRCPGGTDCDDSNPAVHPGATEVCNGVDDNCNNAIDEGGVCDIPGDDCAHAIALDLTRMNTVTIAGNTARARGDFTSGCGGSGPDVVFALTYPTDAEVMIEVVGTAGADHTLSVRNACDGGEFVCNADATRSSRDPRIFLRSTPGRGSNRTNYVVVDSPSVGGPFQLRVQRSSAIAPASCRSQMLNVSSGGTVWGFVYGPGGWYAGSCGGLGREEDILRFDAPRRDSSRVDLYLSTANYVTYVRQEQCSGFDADGVVCGAALTPLTAELDPGPAWIFVDGANLNSGGRYVLRVTPP